LKHHKELYMRAKQLEKIKEGGFEELEEHEKILLEGRSSNSQSIKAHATKRLYNSALYGTRGLGFGVWGLGFGKQYVMINVSSFSYVLLPKTPKPLVDCSRSNI